MRIIYQHWKTVPFYHLVSSKSYSWGKTSSLPRYGLYDLDKGFASQSESIWIEHYPRSPNHPDQAGLARKKNDPNKTLEKQLIHVFSGFFFLDVLIFFSNLQNMFLYKKIEGLKMIILYVFFLRLRLLEYLKHMTSPLFIV